MNKAGNISSRSTAQGSISEVQKSSSLQVINSEDIDLKHQCVGPSMNEENKPVFLYESSSSVVESSGKEEGFLDCKILPSNCLPCLASTVHSVEKRRSLISSPPSARKKSALKLSFKWKEGNTSATLCMYQAFEVSTLDLFIPVGCKTSSHKLE